MQPVESGRVAGRRIGPKTLLRRGSGKARLKPFLRRMCHCSGLRRAAMRMARARSEPVPVDVYIQFVRSLFDNVHMVLIGACCHMLVAFMAYWKTAEPIYARAGGRAASRRRLALRRHAAVPQGRRDRRPPRRRCDWELDYVVKGSIQGLALGSFCFISIYLVPDAFAEIGAVSVTLGSIVTVAGRNYGSPRMVTIFAADLRGADLARADHARRCARRRARPADRAVLLRHQGHGRSRPRGAVLGGHRPQAGAPDRAALRPRAEHHAARADHAELGRARGRRQCRGQGGAVGASRPTRCSAAR